MTVKHSTDSHTELKWRLQVWKFDEHRIRYIWHWLAGHGWRCWKLIHWCVSTRGTVYLNGRGLHHFILSYKLWESEDALLTSFGEPALDLLLFLLFIFLLCLDFLGQYERNHGQGFPQTHVIRWVQKGREEQDGETMKKTTIRIVSVTLQLLYHILLLHSISHLSSTFLIHLHWNLFNNDQV